MGRWQPLRDELPVEAVRLVRELRQYVDRSELNAVTLATRTGYSRSSWLRYLNGRRLPPWPAVAGLGRLAHADAEHLRVLWESAAHAWTRENLSAAAPPGRERPGHASDAHPLPAANPRTRRMSDGTGVLTAVAAACAMLAAVLLARPWDSGQEVGQPPDGAPSGAPAWPWPLDNAEERAAAACRADGCRGLDPYREQCDRDSVTVHRLRAYGHVLTLQYSPSCQASWAEVDTPAATAGLRISTTDGDEQPAAAGGAYTALVGSGPDATRATVVVHGHQLGVAQHDSWVDDVTGTG